MKSKFGQMKTFVRSLSAAAIPQAAWDSVLGKQHVPVTKQRSSTIEQGIHEKKPKTVYTKALQLNGNVYGTEQ